MRYFCLILVLKLFVCKPLSYLLLPVNIQYQPCGSGFNKRLLLELFYHWKTGKHLDILNWTLCSGSRYSVGGVPIVGWHGGYDRLSVGWCNAGSRDDEELRSRQAVSL